MAGLDPAIYPVGSGAFYPHSNARLTSQATASRADFPYTAIAANHLESRSGSASNVPTASRRLNTVDQPDLIEIYQQQPRAQ
jgi:hypothetical protein